MIRQPPDAANGGSQASPQAQPTVQPIAPAGALGSENANRGAPSPIGGPTLYVGRQVARRAGARSGTKKYRNLKLMLTFLILALIGVTFAWILAWAKVNLVKAEKLTLDRDLRHMERDLAQTRARLEQRESELVALVKNRIPGLKELAFNQLIDIDDKYVQNVTFAESGVAGATAIEYHAMLKNATSGMILPDVKILLFDEIGIQAGLTKLKKGDASAFTVLEELAPGESRSYHARIEIERDAVPKYYTLHIR